MDVNHKLKQLETEIQPYKAILNKAADSVLDQEISKYPIFVVHQQTIEIGVPLVAADDVQGKWSVHASTLEEFVTKQLVENQRIDDFKKIYKDPLHHFCLFVLSDLGATFIFVPRTH